MIDIQKIITNIKSIFLLNKQKRKIYRTQQIKSINNKRSYNTAKNKIWGISYSIFDGEEILESSLHSIRNEANYINVVYQNISWYGEKTNDNLINILNYLKEKNLIDEIIEYTVDIKKKPSESEREKRNLGLQYALRHGCDYFMTMDCDEFWISEEVSRAKAYIIKQGITHSYCPQKTYGPSPTRLHLSAGNCYVPFFSKIYHSSQLVVVNHNTPCLIDPTRKLNHYEGAYYQVLHLAHMHHMRDIRVDIEKKYRNSSYNDGELRGKKYKYTHNKNEKYADVENIFSIHIPIQNKKS